MATWVNIEELFKGFIQCTEPDKLFIDYIPDYGEATLSGEETGLADRGNSPISQKVKTELDLGGWHPFLTKEGRVILVSHNATKAGLTLSGKPGYDNAEELFQRIGVSCYSNKTLRTKGDCLTKKLFAGLSEWLQLTAEEYYWIANKDRARFHGSMADFNVFCVRGGNMNYTHLYDSNGYWYSSRCALRPYINLPSNIIVDVGDEIYDGSRPERALKIMRVDPESIPKPANGNQDSTEVLNAILAEIRALRSDFNEAMKNLK